MAVCTGGGVSRKGVFGKLTLYLEMTSEVEKSALLIVQSAVIFIFFFTKLPNSHDKKLDTSEFFLNEVKIKLSKM